MLYAMCYLLYAIYVILYATYSILYTICCILCTVYYMLYCMRRPGVLDSILSARSLADMIRATDGVSLYGSKDGFTRAHLISHILICGLVRGSNYVAAFVPIWKEMKSTILDETSFVGFGPNTQKLMDLFLPIEQRDEEVARKALFTRAHNFLMQEVAALDLFDAGSASIPDFLDA